MLQEVQAGTYARAGGQPGHRAAWLSPEANALTHDYFASTLPVLDAQYLRPRHPGYLGIQNEGSLVVHEYLSSRGKAKRVLERLDAIHRAATKS
jgi:multiple sugar transport system substrate-binding protein